MSNIVKKVGLGFVALVIIGIAFFFVIAITGIQVFSRYVLNREIRTEYTADGPVRVKHAEGYGVSREKAEYEDLKRIAEEQNLTLREARKLLD